MLVINLFSFSISHFFALLLHGAFWLFICSEVTERRCSVGGTDIEYAAYDNHIHNEEVYHHLCSIKKRNTLVTQVENDFIQNTKKVRKNYENVFCGFRRVKEVLFYVS